MKAVLSLILVSVFSISSWATTSACKDLKAELAAMKKAQNQIMMSLVNNHETFATSLEEYSEAAERPQSKSSSQTLSKSMNKSAEAFRTRGVQGKKMAQKLDKATEDLLARVANCL